MPFTTRNKYLIFWLSCIWIGIVIVLVCISISKFLIFILLITIVLALIFLIVKEKLKEDNKMYHQIRKKKVRAKKNKHCRQLK